MSDVFHLVPCWCHLTACINEECHYSKCRYAEFRYAESHYAECHYAECRYFQCHGVIVAVFSENKMKKVSFVIFRNG